MSVITLQSVPSTNTWTKNNAATLGHGDIVVTADQTAGRGQRGNHWESEPGRNLTFSVFLHPVAIAPAQQFLISEIVSLAVASALRHNLPEAIAKNVAVKWPNDIYVGNSKIAGILIEHTISGAAIGHTVVGIGLNVNQERFISNAPNPVSMKMLSGQSHNLDTFMHEIASDIVRQVDAPRPDATHTAYLESLWRNDGCMHQFATPDGTVFHASIVNVAPSGMLCLSTPDGTNLEFAFKEVAFIL